MNNNIVSDTMEIVNLIGILFRELTKEKLVLKINIETITKML